MATITFDTLKFVERLRAGGVPEEQAKAEAEALVTAFSEAMDSQLATKTDINRLERELIVIKRYQMDGWFGAGRNSDINS